MQSAGGPARTPAGIVCGDYAVNTMQPTYRPYWPGTADASPAAQTHPTIGDRLNDAGVDWAWYSGGWSNANGDVGAPGWTNGAAGPTCARPERRRRRGLPALPGQAVPVPPPAPQLLRRLRARHTGARRAPARRGRVPRRRPRPARLKPVSFVKPVGEENEHPGYASEPDGSDHLVDLLDARSRTARRARTRWSSSPTTSSAGSGTTSRRPAMGAATAAPRPVGSGHAHPGAAHRAALRPLRVDHTAPTTRPRS